jgi:hypothetical protein
MSKALKDGRFKEAIYIYKQSRAMLLAVGAPENVMARFCELCATAYRWVIFIILKVDF